MLQRDDHCTHPNQEWCDCDWCRLVRAEYREQSDQYPSTVALSANRATEADA